MNIDTKIATFADILTKKFKNGEMPAGMFPSYVTLYIKLVSANKVYVLLSTHTRNGTVLATVCNTIYQELKSYVLDKTTFIQIFSETVVILSRLNDAADNFTLDELKEVMSDLCIEYEC
jgi:hypothetical protein